MSEFQDLVQCLQLALKALAMYTGTHPRTHAAVETLSGQLDQWLALKPSIHIAASQGKLFLDGAPFEGKHLHLTALARQLSERQISGIILQRGVTQEELLEVLALLALKPARIEEAGGAQAILAAKQLPHVRLGQTQYKEVREGEGGKEDHGGAGANGPAAEVAAMQALAAALTAARTGSGSGQGGPGSGPGGAGSGPGGPGSGPGGTGSGPGGPGSGPGGTGSGPGGPASGPGGTGSGPGGPGSGPGGTGSGPGGSGSGPEGPGSGPGSGSGPEGPGSGPGGTGGAQGGPGASSGPATPAFDLQIITDQWEEQLDSLPHTSLLDGAFGPADLGFLGGTAASLGMGDGFPPAQQMEGLRRALLKLQPEALLSVVAGMDTLPAADGGLRMGFQALAGEAFAHAAGQLIRDSGPWAASQEAIFGSLRHSPQRKSMLAALDAELKEHGGGEEQLARLQELIGQLDWESLPVEEKLRLAQDHGQFWLLTLHQRLSFLRSLLDEGRLEAFLGLVDQLLEGLGGEDTAHRELAAQTLAGVTRWMSGSLPPEAEGPIIQGLAANFGWEPQPHVHRSTTEALKVVLATQVERGEPGLSLSLLQELTGLCAFQDDLQGWRETALADLRSGLADPAALRRVTELLHTANPETMLSELIPYLEAVGEPACRLLVELLGNEPDRKRRGRLLEAIRGLGEAALPAVREGLDSPAWYLVRNALNLLGDIGDASMFGRVASCLGHPDGRVKRAAVRTLWKMGGPAAVAPLLAALPSVDPETQLEIMFGLGQLRSTQAIPALAGFAQERRNPDRLRVRAAETIGQIGDPGSLPILADLVRRKGRIFTTAEPVELRVAASRALLAVGGPASIAAFSELVAAEPWNKDRAALQQVLDQHRGA